LNVANRPDVVAGGYHGTARWVKGASAELAAVLRMPGTEHFVIVFPFPNAQVKYAESGKDRATLEREIRAAIVSAGTSLRTGSRTRRPAKRPSPRRGQRRRTPTSRGDGSRSPRNRGAWPTS
jgi:hypothetical protein